MKSDQVVQRIPFSFLRRGEIAQIVHIRGDGILKKRLLDLGILPGTQIEFLNGGKNLPCVIKIDGTQVMMGWDVLSALTVSV